MHWVRFPCGEGLEQTLWSRSTGCVCEFLPSHPSLWEDEKGMIPSGLLSWSLCRFPITVTRCPETQLIKGRVYQTQSFRPHGRVYGNTSARRRFLTSWCTRKQRTEPEVGAGCDSPTLLLVPCVCILAPPVFLVVPQAGNQAFKDLQGTFYIQILFVLNQVLWQFMSLLI